MGTLGAVPGSPIVRTRGLRRTYGDRDAVAGVDLEVAPGEIFAFLGPNGAGKTTTVEILEGFRTRTAGEVEVLGVDPVHFGPAERARLGCVLQSGELGVRHSAREVLTLWATYFPDPHRVDEMLDLVDLADHGDVRLERLSGGQRRRVEVALALIGRPDLVFLDEPTTGFDPEARRHAWDVIAGLRTLGVTIFLTTHYLEEAEHLADHVAVIRDGTIVADGTLADVAGGHRTRVRFTLPPGVPSTDLPAVDGDLSVDADGVVVRTDAPTAALAHLCGWAAARGHELAGLRVDRPSLEDVYLELVAAPGAPAPATVHEEPVGGGP